jgi:hypothetical protein
LRVGVARAREIEQFDDGGRFALGSALGKGVRFLIGCCERRSSGKRDKKRK